MQGRGFANTDTGDAAKVVIVNEAFVRTNLPNDEPIGLSFNVWGADWRIVGICEDAKYASIKEEIQPTTYFPVNQRADSAHLDGFRRGCLIARTALPPLVLSSAVRKAVAAIDPGVVITQFTTQAAIRDKGISRERLLAISCSMLGGLAVLLSCIGVYGLVAYNVTRRTSEIGIRMALGATRRDITRPILCEALQLCGIGIVVGVPVALGLIRFVKSQLYGVNPNDPATLICASLVLLLTALVAAWIPARRASKTDPMAALRVE